MSGPRFCDSGQSLTHSCTNSSPERFDQCFDVLASDGDTEEPLCNADGSTLLVEADVATVDIAEDRSALFGNVEVIASAGLTFRSEELLITLSELDIVSPGQVRGETSFGTLEAGAMKVVNSGDREDPQWVFTDGVKMLYQPHNAKD